MIIIRYLVRETLKSQIAILFILLLIFFCQNLVRVLGDAVDGDVPTNLVLSLLALGVPKMAQLILPLSLFLGLLMTLGRLYTESEITVMHACGLGKRTLIIAAMVLALFTAAAAAANVFWIGPWASSHQDEVIAEAKANPSVAGLAEGQFKPSQDGNSVLFIGNVKGNTFNDVFLAQLRPNGNQRPSVVVAEHALGEQQDVVARAGIAAAVDLVVGEIADEGFAAERPDAGLAVLRLADLIQRAAFPERHDLFADDLLVFFGDLERILRTGAHGTV